MRSLIQIYALAVCFATLMCFAIALGVGLYDVVQIAAPRITLPYYQLYESTDSFLQYHPDKHDLPEGEIVRLRDESLLQAIRAERHAALQSGLFALIILAIDVGVFAVHWRLARRERSRLGNTQPPSPTTANRHIRPSSSGQRFLIAAPGTAVRRCATFTFRGQPPGRNNPHHRRAVKFTAPGLAAS